MLNVRRVVDAEGAVVCGEGSGVGRGLDGDVTLGLTNIWLVFKAWRLRGDDQGSKSLGAGR